ncbi:hypothetical protein LIER_39168 [Lithospermum erythrorhizon]|uniref:Reverse transcriptase n=1 Tax=Lithospermum erythrorhizon TaxID=34254 RepID=A0AAV3QEQ1_LITER
MFIYASCDDAIRLKQLAEISGRNPGDHKGWCLFGDFNDILHKQEKIGGVERSEASMRMFRGFVEEASLLDMGFMGQPFTWLNRRDREACVKMRLDRVLSNANWCVIYPEASCSHLSFIVADHCPLLVDTKSQGERVKRRFIFDRRWINKEGCEEVMLDYYVILIIHNVPYNI